MIATSRNNRRQTPKNRAAIGDMDVAAFAMHQGTGIGDRAAEDLTNGLMTEADSEIGVFVFKSVDDLFTDPGIGWSSRSR